jgi:hypothetical protein
MLLVDSIFETMVLDYGGNVHGVFKLVPVASRFAAYPTDLGSVVR